jgi:hypothetical protein
VLLAAGFPVAAHGQEPATDEAPDALYLNGGRVLRGKIADDVSDSRTIVIQTPDGKYWRFPRRDVARVVRGRRSTPTITSPPAARPAPAGTSPQVMVPYRRKEPGVAWVLSFLVAGAGQGYNEQWGKAAAFFASGVVATTMYVSNRDDCKLYNTNCGIRDMGIGLALAIWVASQIDAPVSAVALNRRHRVAIELRPAPHPLGISLASVRF